MTDEGFTNESMAVTLQQAVRAWGMLPKVRKAGAPEWSYNYLDLESGTTGAPLTEDEILVVSAFVVMHYGFPTAVVKMNEEAGFDIYQLTVAEASQEND
jgi:hypothetical protein